MPMNSESFGSDEQDSGDLVVGKLFNSLHLGEEGEERTSDGQERMEPIVIRICRVVVTSPEDDRVPGYVREAYRQKKSLHTLEDISDTLSVSNYKSKFEKLLWWEELTEAEEKSKNDERNVWIRRETEEEKAKRISGRDLLDLRDVPSKFELKLERIPFSLKVMDELELRSQHCFGSYQGRVVKVRNRFVDFTLTAGRGESVRSIEQKFKLDYEYDVGFSINRASLSRCHSALSAFRARQTPKLALFPPSSAKLSAPLIDASNLRTSGAYLHDRTLNESQRDAVIGMLESRCRPSIYILFGPPGTGKTATIVETILQIHRRKPHFKLLVCGTSNDCTDVLTRALLTSATIDKRKLVRLSADNRFGEVARDIRPVTVVTEELKRQQRDGVDHSIYLTTCSQSDAISGIFFHYVFVDEAGSAKEPEALIALSLLRLDGAAILAGDHKQLGPTCKSKEAEENGLGVSLLERLYQHPLNGGDQAVSDGNFDSRFMTMLSVCYRCDERIMEVNNEMFYSNQLKFVNRTPSEWLTRMDSQSPLMLVQSSSGRRQRQVHGTSQFNAAEARIVVKLVKKLYGFGLSPEKIGVATPYRAQVDHLIRLFKKERMSRCKIETVEKFQGDQREVMIITTVMSAGRSSDFSRDPRRFNVATSRAMWMVILVGDPETLELDDCWREYIHHACEISI